MGDSETDWGEDEDEQLESKSDYDNSQGSSSQESDECPVSPVSTSQESDGSPVSPASTSAPLVQSNDDAGNNTVGYYFGLGRLRGMFTRSRSTSSNTGSSPMNIPLNDQFNQIIQEAQQQATSGPASNRPMTRSIRRTLGIGSYWTSRQSSSTTQKRSTTEGSGSGDAGSQPKISRRDYSPRNSSLRETLSERRSLVEQQKQAYEESLKADQEKEKKKAQEEKEKQEKIKAEQSRKDVLHQRKLKALENLPKEPDEAEEGVFNLIIRLPTGTKVRRNFRPTDTLFVLRNFVISHDNTPLVFDIIRYPNVTIPVGENDGSMTLEAYGFKGNELLHVRNSYKAEQKSESDPDNQ